MKHLMVYCYAYVLTCTLCTCISLLISSASLTWMRCSIESPSSRPRVTFVMLRKGSRIKSSKFLEQFPRLDSSSVAPLIPTRFFISLSPRSSLFRRGQLHSRSAYEALLLLLSFKYAANSRLSLYIYMCV